MSSLVQANKPKRTVRYHIVCIQTPEIQLNSIKKVTKMYLSRIFFLVAVTLLIQFTYSVPIEPEDDDVHDEIEWQAVWEPVCGSNGKTYANSNYLKDERMKRNPNLRVKHEGVCEEANKILCLGVWEPVCGSDGKTYSNDCHLYVEFLRTKNPKLKVLHQGECIGNTGVHFTIN